MKFEKWTAVLAGAGLVSLASAAEPPQKFNERASRFPESLFLQCSVHSPRGLLVFRVNPGNKVDERLLTVDGAPLVNGPRRHHNDVARTDLS